MPREIDTIPTPVFVKPMKLIVLSASRTGTYGIYQALQQIGFKPYHLAEVTEIGASAFRIMIDGAKAELLHDGKRYGREEFDKTFAGYDVVIEIPFFMLRSIVKAYPDAKFLLTERDPEKWAKSYLNTLAMASNAFNQLPMSVFKYFDGFAFYMNRLGNVMTNYYTNNLGTSDEARQALIENYKDYIADVKHLVPPEQLKVCKLEDGFGWNELCPYLGVPIPDLPWPSQHNTEQFKVVIEPRMRKAIFKGMLGVATIVGVAAVGAWYARKGLTLLR
ncbi:P-loop containing nucleoside triphosphate hydrolase protein [Xylaria intraflava]|nr:P-loop containing nucleoside triphosphate hydrolase protein [Xylaria intraflava]